MHVMYDVTASGTMLPFGDTVVTAVLGYGVVFLGLLMLMTIVCLMGAVFRGLEASRPAREAKRAARKAGKTGNGVEPAAPAVPAATPAAPAKTAPGSAGEVKRFDVPDKEAAMIMAIVAEQMGKPLNELRFLSIKEVK